MKKLTLTAALLAALALTACGSGQQEAPATTDTLVLDHAYPLDYARQFTADVYTDGSVLLTIAESGDKFLVRPEGAAELSVLPEGTVELRQPLENGWITVSRAAGTCTFPARFILCAAMNPCPCGRGEVELGCTCKIEEKRRYQKRISGPLLDRIDLQLEVRQLSQDELLAAPDGEPSAKIRERVIRARQLQQERLGQRKLYCNAQLSSRDLQEFCRLSAGSQLLLRQAITRFKLSPRAYDRILKVARTIADLAGCVDIRDEHIFEAINYRRKEQ